MTATYTWDIFSNLDGYGSTSGDWGGYWGKQGPELLDHRLALYGPEQRMVFGANTYRQSCSYWARAPRGPTFVTLGHSDEELAGNRCVDNPGGTPRLAERDRRER